MSDQPGLTPILIVDRVELARDFYLETLGFEHAMAAKGADGALDFACVARGGVKVMFQRAEASSARTRPGGTQPVQLYLPAADVDAYHAEVAAKGAAIARPPTTEWWGDRGFITVDPYGYELWFFQTVGEPAPPAELQLV